MAPTWEDKTYSRHRAWVFTQLLILSYAVKVVSGGDGKEL
jgi:hypothetical protein